MNKNTEIVEKVLTDLGLRPKVDEDGDVFFQYELKTMYVICRYDEEFLNVIYPQYYELGEDEEYMGLYVCMKETREMKHIKTYLDNDLKNVTSSAEFWYVEETDLKNSLENAIMMLGFMHQKFDEDMKELKSLKENESAKIANEGSEDGESDDTEDSSAINE